MIRTIKPSKYNAFNIQKVSLDKTGRRKGKAEVELLGTKFTIFPNVYGTEKDTELMAKTIKIRKDQNFLEIGCGAGFVSLYLAKLAKEGIGTDINPYALENSKYNAKKLGIENLKFIESDVFDAVNGKFNIIAFNPPYSNVKARNIVDRMFWDTNNETKVKFFREVKDYLRPNGKVYFGWANFKDIDLNLPYKLSKRANLKINNVASTISTSRKWIFYVFEMSIGCRDEE